MALTLGISPCPNDTFIFSALVRGAISLPSELENISTHFADVEELNALAREGRLDIIKISAASAIDILDEYVLLNAGGALGRGCGPLVVARSPMPLEELRKIEIAVPGMRTTANLLLSLHGGFLGPRREMLFDAVIPAVAEEKCAAGVIIHEGRFTYHQRGLHCVLDLGAWWENFFSAPLPLGVIAARRTLGPRMLANLEKAVQASLRYAWRYPDANNDFIRCHAQEMDSAVLKKHIETFVNEFSLELGFTGRSAVLTMVEMAAGLRGVSLDRRNVFVRNEE